MLQEAAQCPPGDDLVYDDHDDELDTGSGEEDEEGFGSGEEIEYEYEAFVISNAVSLSHSFCVGFFYSEFVNESELMTDRCCSIQIFSPNSANCSGLETSRSMIRIMILFSLSTSQRTVSFNKRIKFIYKL